MTFGGDWEWLARLLGLSGPSGRHFCIHCLATRIELSQNIGSSYGLHELDNGAQDQCQNAEEVDESGPHVLRTYEGCKSANRRFVESGSENVLNFQNCKQLPLNWDIGPIIDNISTTPLHVSLGIGLQNVNAIEEMALELDRQVKEAEGQSSDELNQLMNARNGHIEALQELNEQKELFKLQIADWEEQEHELQEREPHHFEKVNRAFVDRSREAKDSRAALKLLTQQKNNVKIQLKDTEKSLSGKEKELEKALSDIEKASGPFKVKFDNTMNALKLKRVVYHSGALIGPDVYKTLQPLSIQLFADIFQPIELNTKSGKQRFGSASMVLKVRGLLTKFAACYKLYTKNAPLCKHEVEQLCLNIMEFGTWFPLNFPDVSLTPKFHMMTFEMPRQVRRLQTIGMLTEQVSESIHPYINKLERMFASTRDIPSRQKLTMKQHNLISGI